MAHDLNRDLAADPDTAGASTGVRPWTDDDDAALAEVGRLYEAGRYLDAHAAAAPLGPYEAWPGPGPRVLAARVAGNLGAFRPARAMQWRNVRAHPADPHAAFYGLFAVVDSRGPWAGWAYCRARGDDPAGPTRAADSPDGVRAEWLAARARLLATLRDFAAAERDINAAVELAPDDPWLRVELGSVRRAEDRRADAEAAHRAALEIRPWFRPAVQALADDLITAGRSAEAIDLLTEANDHVQSGLLWYQLSTVWRERGEPARRAEAIDRAASMLPLMHRDKDLTRAFAAVRAESAYHAGDLPAVLGPARRTKSAYFDRLAGRVETAIAEHGPAAKPDRVLLGVPTVRQHHATCAPATLASIAAYWRSLRTDATPADHAADDDLDHERIAERVCYDGTPWHRERQWAEETGHAAREFRVTFDAARSLIDRGVPFTLTTQTATTGHLQAVAGYDATAGYLLVRDPGTPHLVEHPADWLIALHPTSGPRGMAFAPHAQAHRLDGLDLPDAAAYDRNHAAMAALARHDRASAEREVAALRERHADTPLAEVAAQALAAYDNDSLGVLRACDALLDRYGDDGGTLMRKLDALDRLGRRAESLELLERLERDRLTAPVAPGTRDDDPAASAAARDPAFGERLASVLSLDARQSRRTRSLLRRAIERRGYAAGAYFHLGRSLWDRASAEPAEGENGAAERDRLRRLAADAYRFASTIEDKNEGMAEAAFDARRLLLGGSDAALAELEGRARRWQGKSGGPALTYVRALLRVGRIDAALAFADEAIERRSGGTADLSADDGTGDLMLAAAVEHAQRGRPGRARALLDAADGKARPNSLRSARASVAQADGRLDEALALARELADLEPLHLGAHARVADLLRDLEGPPAARAYLAELAAKLPKNPAVHELRYSRLGDDPVEAGRALRRAVELDPTNAWALRELALHLTGPAVEDGSGEGSADPAARLAEANRLCDEAAALDPNSPSLHTVRAHLAARAGDAEGARRAYWRALDLDPDSGLAIAELLDSPGTPDDRAAVARRIARTLAERPLVGGGIVAFGRSARLALPEGELLATLVACRDARPDLWQAHQAVVLHQLDAGQSDPAMLDAALASADAAVGRFPLVAPLWMDLASVHRARLQPAGYESALRRAIEVAPGYESPVHELVEMLAGAGRFDDALSALDAAARLDPSSPGLRGLRANVLWAADREREAVDAAEAVLAAAPGYRWLASRYLFWCDRLGEHDRAIATARRGVASHPGDPAAHLVLAQSLARPDEREDALSALDAVTRLDPREVEAHDLRAVLLAELGRPDDAVAACRPAAFGPYPEDAGGGDAPDARPVPLRGREAWAVATRGDLRGAVRRMRRVLADEPGYGWGWRQVADWSMALDDLDGYAEAVGRLAALSPHEASHVAEVGRAAELRSERADDADARDVLLAEARAGYARALALDPQALSAAYRLIDFALRDGEPFAAAEVITRISPHLFPEQTVAERAYLAAATGDQLALIARLTELCRSSARDAHPFRRALAGIDDRSPTDKARRRGRAAFTRLASRPTSNPHAAAALAESHGGRGEAAEALALAARLRPANPDDPADPKLGPWRLAASAALSAVTSDAPRRLHRRAVRFVERNRDLLAQTDPGDAAADAAWWSAGGAMMRSGRPDLALAVSADWRGRPGFQPWMAYPAVASAHAMGHEPSLPDAEACATAALSLPVESPALRAGLIAWLAATSLRLGRDPAEVAPLLDAVTDAPAGGKGESGEDGENGDPGDPDGPLAVSNTFDGFALACARALHAAATDPDGPSGHRRAVALLRPAVADARRSGRAEDAGLLGLIRHARLATAARAGRLARASAALDAARLRWRV